MFIAEMIQALQEEEAYAFSRELNTGTNARRLFRYLRKYGGGSRDELYSRVFKRSYNAADDHILRNEASLLKQRLCSFILHRTQADIAVTHTCYADYVLAGWCLGRQLTEGAEKYAEKAREKALHAEAWEALLRINRLLFRIAQFGKSSYEKKTARLLALRAAHEKYLHKLHAAEMSYADFTGAAAAKLQRNLRKDAEPFVYHNVAGEPGSVAERYYRYRAEACLSEGAGALTFLQEAEQLLELPSCIPDEAWERMALHAAMAMEQVFAGRISDSLHTFENLLQHPAFASYSGRNLVLFNYVSTLLKVARYKDALRITALLEAEKQEPVLAERLYALKCYALVFMGDAQRLKEALPADINGYDLSIRIYYRLLYTIVFLLRGDGEAAERELLNLQQVKGLRLTVYAPVVKLFLDYIDAFVYNIPGAGSEPEATFSKQHPELLQTLPVRWLLSRISKKKPQV